MPLTDFDDQMIFIGTLFCNLHRDANGLVCVLSDFNLPEIKLSAWIPNDRFFIVKF